MVQGNNSLKFFMAAALGTMASAALPLHASYCTISGCVVTGPGPGPGGSGGGSGGGWNNGETDPPNQCNDSNNYCQGYSPCDYLAVSKPDQCPNPIPKPIGYDYGRDSFPAGSAMAKLLYIVDHAEGVDATSREVIRNAMAWQTEQFAALTPSFDQVIDVFVGQIQRRATSRSPRRLQRPLTMTFVA